MKQEIITKALDVIRAKKREAIFEYNKKTAPLYEDKNFVELDKTLTRLLIENARKESLNETPDKKLENELVQQEQEYKKKLNLENIEPNFSCKLCNDEGIVNGQMCKCLKTEISYQLLKDSGFEKLESFENAVKTAGNLAPFYHKMKEWCNSDFKKNLIYLAGPTGVGKTFLMRCMANELIKRGIVIKITTAFNMNQDFKKFARSYNEELLNKYIDCEVLFIDDLGTEPKYRDITIEYLYLIINERKMRKLPTIITSNLELSDLKSTYDERIYSRIVDRQTSITIYLNGADKRISN